MTEKLDAFLAGPLSNQAGGALGAREKSREAFDHDFADGDDSLRSENRSRRFVLEPVSPLFSYQREMVDGLHTWFGRRDLQRSILVSLPTGGGKTRTALWFARELSERGEAGRVLWVAPSSELVEQAVDCIQDLWRRFPGGPIADVSVNDLVEPRARRPPLQIIFCTVHLAAKRLADVEKFDADLLVFDEAHQAVAATFRRVIGEVRKSPDSRVVGLSATPGRARPDEGDDLRDLFGGGLLTSTELGQAPVEALISRGVLSKLKIEQLPLPQQWEGTRVRSLEGRFLSIDELSINAARFWSVVEAIESRPGGSRTLVFGASLAHCYALAGALEDRGVSAAVVSHATPFLRRRNLIARFESGEIGVLLNKSLLAAGYDCPAISDVVLASPIRSPILWEQILGRVSRGPAVGGTNIGRVWELDDHRAMHSKVLSYSRFLGALWS